MTAKVFELDEKTMWRCKLQGGMQGAGCKLQAAGGCRVRGGGRVQVARGQGLR